MLQCQMHSWPWIRNPSNYHQQLSMGHSSLQLYIAQQYNGIKPDALSAAAER
jgi:hypothetical protein